MGDRTPFVVGLLAIVGIVAWLVLRSGGDDRTPDPPRAAGAQDPSRANPRAEIAAPAGPALPAAGWSESPNPPELPPTPAPTADEVFSEETRDATWAAKTEAEIAQRWRKIRAGKLESIECRHSQCRLLVTGTQDDVATAVGDLEGPRGMHGFARNVHLTGPERRDDGTVALRVFVRFDRRN